MPSLPSLTTYLDEELKVELQAIADKEPVFRGRLSILGFEVLRSFLQGYREFGISCLYPTKDPSGNLLTVWDTLSRLEEAVVALRAEFQALKSADSSATSAEVDAKAPKT